MTEKIKKNRLASDRLARIRFLVLDVDGVLTDGSILYSATGEELQPFNVKDGTGIKYWRRAGHDAGLVTGRNGAAAGRFARDHGITRLAVEAKSKLPVFTAMLENAGVAPEETAVIGDDLPDYPLLRRAGFAVAVADAVPEVKEAADYITHTNGGRGAVRETIEYILKAQGRWDAILDRYLAAGR